MRLVLSVMFWLFAAVLLLANLSGLFMRPVQVDVMCVALMLVCFERGFSLLQCCLIQTGGAP